jgi:hypothetical protein
MRRYLLAALAAFCLAAPVSAQSLSKTRATAAVSAGFVLRAGATNLAGLSVTTGGTAGYVMLFDATAVPADGAVTPTRCLPIAANTGLDLNFRGSPLRFDNGVVVVFSSTGCFTKTGSATAYLAGDIQ